VERPTQLCNNNTVAAVSDVSECVSIQYISAVIVEHPTQLRNDATVAAVSDVSDCVVQKCRALLLIASRLRAEVLHDGVMG
jgi:hypothetical protein